MHWLHRRRGSYEKFDSKVNSTTLSSVDSEARGRWGLLQKKHMLPKLGLGLEFNRGGGGGGGREKMGSFVTTFLGGLGFIAVGCFRAFRASIAPPSPLISEKKRPFYSVELTLIAVVSFLFLLNSFVLIFKALEISDHLVFVLQLQNFAISSLFLLYSAVGIADFFKDCLPLPPSIPNLVALFAFLEEFLLFYHQKKDAAGVENRYFSLLLVPIAICICCIVLDISYPRSRFPELGIGIGLILQGTWFLQMGFSFFTSWIAHGCFLHERSRGDYTIKCKGHAEYHRSRAIATLQFNLHLAALVILTVRAYSILGRKMSTRYYDSYKRIGRNEELQDMGNVNYGQFTLDSDEEDAVDEIIVEQQQPTSASAPKTNESCRNGCTQRIHAFENSLLSEHWPNSGGSTLGPSFVKDGYNVDNAIEWPSAIPSALGKQKNTTKNGNLTWPKEMIDVGGRTDTRYPDMVFSIPSSRSKKDVCQQSKFDNRNLPEQLLVSGPHTTKPLPQTMASVTSNTSRPGENTFTDAVEKFDNDFKRNFQLIESGKESPRECEEDMVLSCHNKCTAGSTNEVDFIRSDILNVSARNSHSECPVKEVSILHDHDSGCPPVGSHGSGPGDGASILASNMDRKKESVEYEDDSEACTLPSTKVIHNGDQGQEVINHINPIKHGFGVSNGLGANPVEQSVTGSETLLQNTDTEEKHCKSVATPFRTVNDKFLKYTFHRKRKREVMSNKTEEVVAEKKPCSKKRSARRRCILHKLPDFGKVMESSRDSRLLMQVARQLISLSEMRW